MADPSRRAIFESLTRGEVAVKDLTSRFDISQPAVSQHLAALREAGLVRVRVDGSRRVYSTDPAALDLVATWVRRVTPTLEHHLDAHTTEAARGRRERRGRPAPTPAADHRAS
ncbi:MAG: metalloregulator ArsR/SmtB family transcription factor [Actinomycetota bacterium]|nr:metalloregulator ArsR/SmtB family transcription factor [Actinomycetota bacterium]